MAAIEADTALVSLEARIGQYRTDIREAIDLQRQYQNGWGATAANNNGPQQQAQSAKKAAADTVKAEEQATEAVKRTRKSRTAAAKQEDAEQVASAKAAAKAESKAKADALREEVAAAKAAAREMAAIDKARSTEQQLANQARAAAFLTPLGTRGTSGQSAKASADVFRQAFREEAAAAKEAAAAVKVAEAEKQTAIGKTEAVRRRPLEIISPTLPASSAWEGGRNAGKDQNVVVVQPIHADFSGARTDEQTMTQFMQYADARSAQAYHAAVNTAGGQVGSIVQRNQTLGQLG